MNRPGFVGDSIYWERTGTHTLLVPLIFQDYDKGLYD